MIDVMNKLKEIAESGYDNEDIQRGIDAAATQKFDEESVMERDKQKKMKREDQKLDNDEQIEEEEYAMERDGMKKKMKREDQKLTKDAVEEEEAVEEDAVEEVHESVEEEDTSLADMLRLAGRSGVMGLSQNNIIAESLELDEEDEVEVREDTEENEVKRVIAKILGTYRPLTYDDFDNQDLNFALYDYFVNSGEMPYGTAKARDGDPNEWIFDKLNSLGMTEAIEEAEVEETVEVPVSALSELMRLAGYENYEAKINEYENDPEEEYMDVEDQMIGLSGGLNGPKKAYAAAAGGDNAMAQEPTEVEESLEESFYKEYSQMIEDLKSEDLKEAPVAMKNTAVAMKNTSVPVQPGQKRGDDGYKPIGAGGDDGYKPIGGASKANNQELDIAPGGITKPQKKQVPQKQGYKPIY